jgi:hypothetical protein
MECEPLPNQWYRDLDTADQFQVVAVDEDGRAIEIQYLDGNIEEIDFDEWSERALDLIEPPEDWTASMDDVQRDDLGYSDTAMTSEDWVSPRREQREIAEEPEDGEQAQGWEED